MFKNFPPLLSALALMTIALLIAYLGGIFYNRTLAQLPTYYRPAVLTDLDNRPTRAFHSGQTMVVHYFINRPSLDCYSDYFQNLDGPVAVQFGHVRSMVLYSPKVHRELAFMYEIPQHLPPGHYVWRQIAFPTCGSEKLSPINTLLGEIDIR